MDLINWIMLNLYPSNMSVLFGHYDTRHIQTSDYQGWTQVQLPGVKAPPTYVRSLKLLKPTLQTNSKKIIYRKDPMLIISTLHPSLLGYLMHPMFGGAVGRNYSYVHPINRPFF